MTCCVELERLMEREMACHAQATRLENGTILTDIDTEYFLVFGEERRRYVGMHYCPFCGRVLSRELWNLEKKK